MWRHERREFSGTTNSNNSLRTDCSDPPWLLTHKLYMNTRNRFVVIDQYKIGIEIMCFVVYQANVCATISV